MQIKRKQFYVFFKNFFSGSTYMFAMIIPCVSDVQGEYGSAFLQSIIDGGFQ